MGSPVFSTINTNYNNQHNFNRNPNNLEQPGFDQPLNNDNNQNNFNVNQVGKKKENYFTKKFFADKPEVYEEYSDQKIANILENFI